MLLKIGFVNQGHITVILNLYAGIFPVEHGEKESGEFPLKLQTGKKSHFASKSHKPCEKEMKQKCKSLFIKNLLSIVPLECQSPFIILSMGRHVRLQLVLNEKQYVFGDNDV